MGIEAASFDMFEAHAVPEEEHHGPRYELRGISDGGAGVQHRVRPGFPVRRRVTGGQHKQK